MLFVAALVVAVAAWLAGPPLVRGWRQARAAAQPFPPAWRAMLQQRWPLYRRLPPPLQQRLRRHVLVLLAQTPFIGCRGLPIDDEVRVLVAAQAALLLLGRDRGTFANLRQVLVYPDAFVVDRPVTDAAGVVQDARRVLVGESWQRGQLVLSWPEVLAGAADADDGRNVVIHEFAHQLDQETGPANGAPWLAKARRARWAAVLGAAYAELQARLARGESGVLDAYAASDPAEFFAVASENFFERPFALAAEAPALYDELASYYAVDPRAWS